MNTINKIILEKFEKENIKNIKTEYQKILDLKERIVNTFKYNDEYHLSIIDLELISLVERIKASKVFNALAFENLTLKDQLELLDSEKKLNK